MTGHLEIGFTSRITTRQISFPFTMTGAIKDAQGNTRFGVAAQTKIDRLDWVNRGRTRDGMYEVK